MWIYTNTGMHISVYVNRYIDKTADMNTHYIIERVNQKFKISIYQLTSNIDM